MFFVSILLTYAGTELKHILARGRKMRELSDYDIYFICEFLLDRNYSPLYCNFGGLLVTQLTALYDRKIAYKAQVDGRTEVQIRLYSWVVKRARKDSRFAKKIVEKSERFKPKP